MKAQRIRKALWISNAALVASVVGVGALLVLDKPVEAKSAPEWATKALAAYKDKPVVPRMAAAVEKGDIEAVFLKPEWKDLPYFPFVGPRIPAPRAKEAAPVERPKGPTGLEAIGRVKMLMFRPPDAPGEAASQSTLLWEFNGGEPKTGVFSPGDFIVQRGQPGRFKLVDILQPDPAFSRRTLVYEVYDDPKGQPVSRGELIYDNEPKIDESRFRPSGTPAAPAGAKAPGEATAGPGAAAAPAPAPAGARGPGNAPGVIVVGSESGGQGSSAAADDWKPEIVEVSPGRRAVTFDDKMFEKFKGKDVEKVLENFRTEEYSGDGVQGLMITPVGDTSVASKFDVRRGDVLIAIDGKPTRTRDDAIRVARGISPEATRVSVEIDRDGRRITYDVDPRDPKTRRAAAGLAGR